MSKIAIPVVEEKLCMHFGHCEVFAMIEVDGNSIEKTEMVKPPPHEPGVIPRWLNEQGVNRIIAGGMGAKAIQFFEQFGIDVVIGAPSLDPEEVVRQYLDGTLQTGANVCDH